MTFTQRGGGVERKAKTEDVCGCSKGGGGWVETDMCGCSDSEKTINTLISLKHISNTKARKTDIRK